MNPKLEVRSPGLPPTVLGQEDVPRAPTQSEQRRARIMGAWFLATFVFSIPALWFYDPVLNNTNYILGGGADTRVAFGALCEILSSVSGIATAVVIYPVVKRVSESIALGYIAARIFETTVILIGMMSL